MTQDTIFDAPLLNKFCASLEAAEQAALREAADTGGALLRIKSLRLDLDYLVVTGVIPTAALVLEYPSESPAHLQPRSIGTMRLTWNSMLHPGPGDEIGYLVLQTPVAAAEPLPESEDSEFLGSAFHSAYLAHIGTEFHRRGMLRPLQPAHTTPAIAGGSQHQSLHKLSAQKGASMIEATSELVTLKRFPTLEEANRAAGLEAGNTGALSIPVVAFRQGKRTVTTGALPMSWVRNRLESRSAKSAKKGGSMRDAEAAWNRPELPEHSQSIAKYILENYEKAYIIPPLSLNIQHRVHLYIPDYPSDFIPGYLVIPGSATLAITDGQHRRTGIVQAMDQMDEVTSAKFASDAVAIMITCETDLNQIHQDFADCSKTKPLPPSLLAVYDRRNPANRLVSDLERMCPLFKGRIDPTSKTLSKKSTFLFLANQLRQLVKELLAGSYAMADLDFEKRAVELLGHEEQYNAAVVKFVEYINYLTGFTKDTVAGEDGVASSWNTNPSIPAIPVWREIAKLPVGTLEISQVPVKREEGWICLSATGLNLIGRVGHKLFTNADLATKWKHYADKLGDPQTVDWKRDATIWQGNIIQGTKLLTQQAPVKHAYEQVLQAIGLANTLPILQHEIFTGTKESVND